MKLLIKTFFKLAIHGVIYNPIMTISITFVAIILLGIGSPAQAAASSWWGSDTGFWSNSAVHTSSVTYARVLNDGLNEGAGNTCSNSQVTDITSFVKFVRLGLYSGDSQRETASAFIVLYTYMGEGDARGVSNPISTAKSLLPQNSTGTWGYDYLNNNFSYHWCDNTNSSSYNSVTSGNCSNTLYMTPSEAGTSYGDVGSFSDSCSDLNNLYVASFFNKSGSNAGKPFFVVKYLCGNPLGANYSATNWTLHGYTDAPNPSTVSNTSTNVSFTHYIHNNGPDQATSTYQVQYELKGSGWAGTTNTWLNETNSISGDDIGSVSPSAGVDSRNLTNVWGGFRNGVSPGAQYCQRIEYTNANGPDPAAGYNGWSDGSCVTYNPTGGGTGTTGCTEERIPTGAGYSGDTTLRYAVYKSPPGNSPSDPSWSSSPVYGAWSDSKPTTYPDLTSQAIYVTPSPVADNTTYTYTAPASDWTSGTVTWYYAVFNFATMTNGKTGKAERWRNYTIVDSHSGVNGDVVNNCFQASCTNFTVPGDVPNGGANDVEASESFSYSAAVADSGANSLPATLSGTNQTLTITPSYTNGSSPSESDVGAIGYGGSSGTLNFNSIAPNDTAAHSITLVIGYPGSSHLTNIGSCSQSVYDYQSFKNTVNTSLVDASGDPNDENPTKVSMNYQYYQNGSAVSSQAPSYLPTTGRLNYTPDGGSASQVWSSSVSPTTTATYTIPPAQLDDTYCATVSYAAGWVGPAGAPNPYIVTTQTSSPSCDTVHNKPYVDFTGNDVIGDAAFLQYCGNNSGIYTYSDANAGSTTGPTAGSYSQFGTQALATIEGLTSAGLRSNGSAKAPTDLSIANTGSGVTVGGAYLGGSSGIKACQSDYSDSAPTSGTTSLDSVGGTLTNAYLTSAWSTSATHNYTFGSGSNSTLTIGGSNDISVPNSTQTTVFVNGNVYINRNIIYTGASNWNAIASIPSFYIVATGNIYIAPNVTELDGVYIAEPYSNSTAIAGASLSPTTSGGIIDTCAQSIGPYSATSLVATGSNQCGEQLVINGAFVDVATLLDRTFSSLRYSQTGENINNTAAQLCGTPGADISGSYSSGKTFNTCAAEVFNFSPEIYLAQPSFTPTGGLGSGRYNYITSLSPLL